MRRRAPDTTDTDKTPAHGAQECGFVSAGAFAGRLQWSGWQLITAIWWSVDTIEPTPGVDGTDRSADSPVSPVDNTDTDKTPTEWVATRGFVI